MNCRMGELRNKEVISVSDGTRIGFISDIEIDTSSSRLTAIVIYGRLRLFGLLGRRPDIVIPWREIALIGDDTVLVNMKQTDLAEKESKIEKFFDKIGI